MKSAASFQDFLVNEIPQIDIKAFVINIVLAAFFSYILRKVYLRYSKEIGDKDSFSKNFLLLTTTTMLIISVVKSSLALSLGLVGALSIVRFRTAIKSPEELSFLFLSIAVGLGLGAGQAPITSLGFLLILSFFVLSRKRNSKPFEQVLHLNIYSQIKDENDLLNYSEILKKHSKQASLKKYHDTKQGSEASFLISIDDPNNLADLKSELRSLNSNIDVTFLEHQPVI